MKSYSLKEKNIKFFNNVPYFMIDSETDNKVYITQLGTDGDYRILNLSENFYIENANFEQKMFGLLNFLSYDNKKNPNKQRHYSIGLLELYSGYLKDMRDIWNEKVTDLSEIVNGWCLPSVKNKSFRAALDDIKKDMIEEKQKEMTM